MYVALNKKIKAVHLLTTQKRPISTAEKGKKMKFENYVTSDNPKIIRREIRELRSNLLYWQSVEAKAQRHIKRRSEQIKMLEIALSKNS